MEIIQELEFKSDYAQPKLQNIHHTESVLTKDR
jgi:hypothetical protein